MQKKLTITLEEDVFTEDLARPRVMTSDMEEAYRQMAADEAREAEALEWAEGTLGDVADEAR